LGLADIITDSRTRII